MNSRLAPLLGVVLLGGVVLVINLVKVEPPPQPSPLGDPLAEMYAALHPTKSAQEEPARGDRIISVYPFVREHQGAPHLLAQAQANGRPEVVRLQPLDGGDPVWEYGLTTRSHRPVRLFMDDEGGLALIAQGTRVVALGLEDGARRWSIVLSDKIESIGRRDGRLVVLTEDRRVRSIDPALGDATPTTSVPLASELLRADDKVGAVPREVFTDRIRLEGLTLDATLCGPRHPCPRLSGAAESAPAALAFAVTPRKQCAVLVRYDDQTRDELWRRTLGGVDCGAGWGQASPSAVLVEGDAIVTYLSEDDATYFVRVGLADGALRWEKHFARRSSGMNWNHITVSDGRLLYSDGRSLRELNPETGAETHCLGPCTDV